MNHIRDTSSHINEEQLMQAECSLLIFGALFPYFADEERKLQKTEKKTTKDSKDTKVFTVFKTVN
jgi:hypothetical protein